ncbi:MAG: T9SS type A sorting domain-containing protein [Saprospiraceae bacterium]|nr:T9SS type A sorting domain-containing protein [Saprospiraceae bacterium]
MRTSILSLVFLFITLSVFGQNRWSVLDRFPENQRNESRIVFLPKKFSILELDYHAFQNDLLRAPEESQAGRNVPTISLPTPEGEVITFNVFSSPVMEPLLAAKYPSIKSYKAWSNDKKYVARFDLSPYGLRASIRGEKGEIYIDPYYKDNVTYYIAYYTKDHTEPMDLLSGCGTEHDAEAPRELKPEANRTDVVNLHVYKIALACTGEWGKIRGTVENALADMNTSVNRLNQIFENELGTRIVLIDENDKLIHLDGNTDPYSTPQEGRKILSQNSGVINDILGGSAKYDFGHVFTIECTAGLLGVAFPGSICDNANLKGGGVTCFYANLIYVIVETTAHEMGHQFDATHTYNSCFASSQNAGADGFEPGGGSTIMSYGQLCGANSFVNGADDYYHNGSLHQMYNRLRSSFGGAFGCADKIATNNHEPQAVINIRQGLSLPLGTPFVLDGSGIDEDEDPLTYCWEEKDASFTLCPLGQPTESCPLFRSFPPDILPYRIFPSPSRILQGQNAKDEVLPTYGRAMKFTFTVRDNNPEAGYAVWKEIEFNVDGNSGPFQVTSPNSGEKYQAGSIMPVSWNVNNTNLAPVNCKYVDIYLSKKNALHTSDPNLILLAGRVPNTGSANVQLPEVTGADARVLIKAQDNIFFDVSNFKFTVNESNVPTAYIRTDKYFEKLCLPATAEVNINTVPIAGYAGNIRFGVDALPPGITFVAQKESVAAGQDNKLSFILENSLLNGNYIINYYAVTDNNDTLWKRIEFEVISTDYSSLQTLFPVNGEKDAELPTFTWNKSINALSYTIEVSKDPAFSTLEFSETTTDSFYRHFKTFDKKSVYYWRVRASNSCNDGAWTEIKGFGTLVADCKTYSANGLPINISGSGSPTIESKINVPTGTNISDVNVAKLKINHNNFKDLTGTLVSPAGTRVILWENICEKQLNIEVLIDDQAPAPFSCSNTASGQYKPKEKLEKLNGENATGVWSLEIKDNKTGNGGKLEGFDMEVCASVQVEDPYQVNDLLLETTPGDIAVIGRSHLLIEDKATGPDQLIYHVTSTPSLGNLFLNNNPVTVGYTFTQDDINNGKLTYAFTATGSPLPADDDFQYLVKDAEGGWIGINRFNIRINSTVATGDEQIAEGIKLYPNPTSGYALIELKDNAVSYNKVSMYNLTGQTIKEFQILGTRHHLDVSELRSGLYLLVFSNGSQKHVQKLILQNN